MHYHEYQVCIVGAGPGGAATALKLSYLDIPCILLDKAVFPRDKICGDAISGKVTTLLNRLDPEILQRFQHKAEQIDVWGVRFIAPEGQILDVPFQSGYIRNPAQAPGYVARRFDFDNFLIEEVRRRPNIKLIEAFEANEFKSTDEGWEIGSLHAPEVKIYCRALVIADGAHSSFSRKVAGLHKDDAHYAAGVRAYYTNIHGFAPGNFIELHFLKRLLPGYFWIFPLPNGAANVGLGMRSDYVSSRKLNLRQLLDEVILEHPELRTRFEYATRVGVVKGYGLPLGSKKRNISGDNYMLVGDAAHLVDPLTGEGIGNAFYSGFIAAEQIKACFENNDFSAQFLKAYDQRVDRVLGSEMRLNYKIQKLLSYSALANWMGRIIAGNARMIQVFSAMYNDFDLRTQLTKPGFWLKMWWEKKNNPKA